MKSEKLAQREDKVTYLCEYRCGICDETLSTVSSTSINGAMHQLSACLGTEVLMYGTPLPKYVIHKCEDGSVGLFHLCGYRVWVETAKKGEKDA